MTFSFQKYYKKITQAGELAFDPKQFAVLSSFETLYSEIKDNAASSFIDRVKNFFPTYSEKGGKKGIYLYGGVGQGKTLLMDMFYNLLPISKKIRIHLHDFLLSAQKEISEYGNIERNPIQFYAQSFCKKYDVLCVDEFYIDHIGDAMFLKRLFEQFFQSGLFIVLTSNTAPRDLYKRGFQRELFSPFIPYLENYMQVISLNGGIDYRLQQKENKMDIRYFVENEEKGTVLFSSLFFQLSKKKAKKQWVKIGKYAYHAEGAFNHIAWFSFHELCENARGKKDYTALAKKFKIWLISSVPPLQPDQYNEVKRFIILIDILYDYGIELWVQGTTIPSLIYTTGKERKAFKRTLSRLIQMTHKNNSII